MAFPPGALPTNRSNTTPQQDTHPNDHNAISAAINDTVGAVLELQQGVQRVGTVANQTGQTVSAGAVVQLGWSSVSDPSFGAGPILTVPSGNKGGVYAASLRVVGPTMPANAFADVVLSFNGSNYAAFIPPGKSSISVCVVGSLDTGQQVFVQVYNPLVTTEFFTGTLTLVRVAA